MVTPAWMKSPTPSILTKQSIRQTAPELPDLTLNQPGLSELRRFALQYLGVDPQQLGLLGGGY